MQRCNWVCWSGYTSSLAPGLRTKSGIMALFRGLARGYITRMKQHSAMPAGTVAKVALGVAAFAAATGLAFAYWIDKGAAIFMATVEAGLAWCF